MTSLIFVEEVVGWLAPTHHLNNDFLTFLEEFFTAITLVYFMKNFCSQDFVNKSQLIPQFFKSQFQFVIFGSVLKVLFAHPCLGS
jgi:hypothetical protein